MTKTAVVLYNLGGPNNLDAVRPFLFNLFNDPAIIRLPTPARWVLAKLISKRREVTAKKIYEKIGNKSPILEETRKQAVALQNELKVVGNFKVFVAMRYWHPFLEECLNQVQKFSPDHIVLLPLYPQFSTTTTNSFLAQWEKAIERNNLSIPTSSVCCYPSEPGFVEAVVNSVKRGLKKVEQGPQGFRVLFSAHGIPKKFVKTGDPYQLHVEQSVASIVKELEIDGLDYVICYQSRVGPIQWLKPYTDQVIIKAAKEKKALLIVPVAFVSEHSETLVELDIDYALLAKNYGAPIYERVPTVGITRAYIKGLSRMVLGAKTHHRIFPYGFKRVCPKTSSGCPYTDNSRGFK